MERWRMGVWGKEEVPPSPISKDFNKYTGVSKILNSQTLRIESI